MESESAALDSRMRWYFDSAAVVRLMDASLDAESVRFRLLSSSFCSRSLRKSEMFSSSVWTEPELPPSRRCAEDEALPFPLLLLSSSVLLPPAPEENFDRRLLKLLL